jgi:Mor family transcriptional regulator
MGEPQVSETSASRRESDKLLCEMEDHICVALQEIASVDAGQASVVAKKVAVRLSEIFGGQGFYLGKARAINARNQALYKEFDGTNYLYLAKQYGLSERMVRMIISELQAADRAARMPQLF